MKQQTLGLLAILLAGALGAARADTLKMECDTTAAPNNLYCEYIKQRFESETSHKLRFITLPYTTDEKRAMLEQVFVARDSAAMDLFELDTVWVGLFSQHLLDLTDQVKDLEPTFFPSAWQNNVVGGRIKAVPSFVTAGMLYYRKDLLEQYAEKPPETWGELVRIASRIQQAEREAGRKNFWGMLLQGRMNEVLTCDALEWIASYNGGGIVEPDGRISVNNPRAARALEDAASWIGHIAPRNVLEHQEEASLAMFMNGDALFMRNWPDSYLHTQNSDGLLRGKVGVVPLPRADENGSHAATLGGGEWAISAYTKNPAAAIALLRIVTDAKSEKMAFMVKGTAPARIALYDDPDVIARAPIFADFKAIFSSGVARPSSQTGTQYPRVSKAVYNAAYDVLSGRISGQQAVAELEARLQRIKGDQWE